MACLLTKGRAEQCKDQVIREYDSWVHISIPANETIKPRKQALIIDKQGTRAYT